jgi:hypothetical protein
LDSVVEKALCIVDPVETWDLEKGAYPRVFHVGEKSKLVLIKAETALVELERHITIIKLSL